jgi:hypothetical protein
MMNELKTQIFKKKLFGLKHKLRFLKDDEKIQEGDLHFKVSGYGVFEFKSQDALMGYLEHRIKEAEVGNWEGKVLKYLSENLAITLSTISAVKVETYMKLSPLPISPNSHK